MNWRTSGDTDLASWTASFPANSDIIKRGEQVATYNAARPYTRLCRGMLEAESSGATHYNAVPASMHNPLNLRIRGKEPFQQFDSIEACVIEWRNRITDPTYAYKDTQTVADLVHIYAPASDNNNEANYVKTVERVIDSLPPLFSVPVEHPSGGTPVSETPLTFGKVPFPPYHDRPITKREGVGSDNLGKRSVIGVTYHRMLGSLNGVDSYFRQPATAALTDYGMGVAATDGADLDAVVYRWNDPLGYQSGWASGKVIAPWGDGLAFVNKYGANAVNKLRASIEISGNYDTPISDAVKQRVAEISAYWADQCQIPWNVYPIRPEDGFSFVCWHQEFTGPQEKVCPGAVVMNATNDIIARTAAILKQYQTQAVVIPPTPKPDKYAAPVTYPWLSQDDGKVHEVGGTRVLPLTLTYTTTRSTPRYQRGSKQGAKIGPNIPKGTTFAANRVFRSNEGIAFVMTRYGSRVLASALMPRVGVTASGRISVRHDGTGAPEVISDNVEAAP
jgi:hypothetical protein